MPGTLGARSFSRADQERFAALSGDRNPIHLDTVAARRTIAKEPIVHGVHALLWALESYFACAGDARPVGGLKVRFERMIPVDALVRLVLVGDATDAVRLDLLMDGQSAATIRLSLAAPREARGPRSDGPLLQTAVPLDRRFDDLVDARGRFVLPPPAPLSREFPHAAGRLGASRTAGLAATSFLVGMICPGLWSIYRALDLIATATPSFPARRVEADTAAGDSQAMSFHVIHSDARFRLLRCAVESDGWIGTLDAHVAPQPVAQPAMGEVAARVAPGEFRGAKALIIGGSRGLGELTAKILAAGGAEVALTYHRGSDDARRVVAEIRAGGGCAETFQYDVLSENAPAIEFADFNQLYFMASPPIRKQPTRAMNTGVLATLTEFFVAAFERIGRQIGSKPHGRVALFYPSTIFIEHRSDGFDEYAAAKRAGEELCERLRRVLASDVIMVRRLPALPTDQTQSLSSTTLADAAAVMLPIAREMHTSLTAE